MKFQKFSSIFSSTLIKLFLSTLITICQTQIIEIIERTQQLSEKVSVSWIVNFPKESITFQVTAKTHGFVGFGISPQGGMDIADVIIGGVRDGEPYFTDRFATGKMEPKIDDHQDWFLLDASENATHTVLRFNRSLNTCDNEDLPITNDTTKFIWSLGTTDEIIYHGDQRGASAVYLLDPHEPSIDMSVFEIWDVTVNTTIPTAATTYWCTIHKTPMYDSKRHVVGFEVKLKNTGALEHNHHIQFQKCRNVRPGTPVGQVLESYIGHPGGACYENDGSGMDDAITYCENYYFVWAKGGLPLILPAHVGLPLNDDGFQEYFMLQIHYDNPKVLAGVQYETGVMVYISDKLRQEEAGMLVIGSPNSISLVIPPESSKFLTVTHCASRCTQEKIPANGLQVFNLLLHSHLAGRQIKLRHFRPSSDDGQFHELPWIFDANYDFDYQQNKALRENKIILPGDHLTCECTYDTTWRQPPSVTLGGFSTRDEMCETFLLYYPRIMNLDICGSEYPKKKLFKRFGIKKVNPASYFKDPTVVKPLSMANKTFSQVLNTIYNWTDKVKKEFQQETRFDDYYETCLSAEIPTISNTNSRRIERDTRKHRLWINYPQNFVPFLPPDECKS